MKIYVAHAKYAYHRLVLLDILNYLCFIFFFYELCNNSERFYVNLNLKLLSGLGKRFILDVCGSPFLIFFNFFFLTFISFFAKRPIQLIQLHCEDRRKNNDIFKVTFLSNRSPTGLKVARLRRSGCFSLHKLLAHCRSGWFPAAYMEDVIVTSTG